MTKYLGFALALLLSCHTLAAQIPVAPGVYEGPNLSSDYDLIMDVGEPDESGDQSVIIIEFDEEENIITSVVGTLGSDGTFTYFIVGGQTGAHTGDLEGHENSGAASLSIIGMNQPLMLPGF